jgi:Ca2+-binding EF-hand superfamily protein
MNPVVAAIDADEDGEISEKEIDNAAAALKALDTDKNGKLTQDELRPNFGGPGGPGGFGGFGGRGGNPEEFVSRLMSYDKNQDGKLASDELPRQVQGVLTRADADKDGFATKDELTKLASQEPGRDGPEGPEGFGGPGGPGGPGGRSGFGGRGGFGGGRDPQAMIDRLFEADTDKDGKLTREELGKISDQLGRGFGRGPGGGRGGDRPERPNRPE